VISSRAVWGLKKSSSRCAWIVFPRICLNYVA
jgi:hypothetical protein